MREVHRLESGSANVGGGAVLAAWERFVRGEDEVPGVRPEVAVSRHRCRERYRVDPHLTHAPVATPAIDPTVRWKPGLPELVGAVRHASRQAARDPDWVGSTQVFTPLTDEPTPVSIRLVFLSGHLIGNLVTFGASDGVRTPGTQAPAHPRPRRVVATRDNRMVLLRLPDVSFAESEGNDVWLSTDQGRLRAASQSLDRFDGELAGAGFLRVHRRHVVNLSRVREVERGVKGELSLVMDGRTNTMVPVSRRNAPAVRRALDI